MADLMTGRAGTAALLVVASSPHSMSCIVSRARRDQMRALCPGMRSFAYAIQPTVEVNDPSRGYEFGPFHSCCSVQKAPFDESKERPKQKFSRRRQKIKEPKSSRRGRELFAATEKRTAAFYFWASRLRFLVQKVTGYGVSRSNGLLRLRSTAEARTQRQTTNETGTA